MRSLLTIPLLLLVVLLPGKGHAQTDPHFSQYYAYPLWLNPALTGAIDGDYRVTGIYRNQWNDAASPFSTPGISADFTTSKNLNIGANVFNQTANGGGYNYLNGYVSLAYTGVRFGANGNQRISLGISAGVINRRFNPSKFTTGEQWNGSTGDATLPNTDILAKTAGTTFDAGAGIMYFDAAPGKKANLFLGFSAYHLTQPQDAYITGGQAEKLPVRYTVHGGVKLNLAEGFSITPNLLYMQQGQAKEKMAGAYGQIRVNESTDFLLGGNYRFKDALSPYVGVYYKNLVLGLSYDVNTSDLGKLGGNANSFEISLSIIGKKTRKADAIPFVCPVL